MGMSILSEPLKTQEHTISNTGNVSVGEDAMLVIISPVTCLFQEGGWKAVGESPVVNEFRVDVVVDLITGSTPIRKLFLLDASAYIPLK